LCETTQCTACCVKEPTGEQASLQPFVLRRVGSNVDGTLSLLHEGNEPLTVYLPDPNLHAVTFSNLYQ